MHDIQGNKAIHLGYEVPGGEMVDVFRSHLIVTGVTQLSGKTTTLEALAERSGLRIIVFKTKPGEKSFSRGTKIAPFFRDRSDYEFVKSLIEAYAKEKLFVEKGTLMTLCKGSNDLLSIKQRIDEVLHPAPDSKKKPPTGLKEEIYVRLEHYLENLIPQIKYANFSAVLNLAKGINIMELGQFSEEAQSLIIQSTADEVLKKEHGVVIIIPEAWKFIPQKYNNPCKRSVEAFIRQGAVNDNYIWIDSQDMSGVDKIPLKSVSTWILGYQRERNEVKHTLDQISLPKKSKPKEEDIMNLRKGQFFVSSYEGVKKVYVQPVWMNDEDATLVAMGKISAESVNKEQSVDVTGIQIQNEDQLKFPAMSSNPIHFPFSVGGNIQQGMTDDEKAWVKKELTEIRHDFFDTITAQNEYLREMNTRIFEISNKSVPDNADEIMAKVLQKIALNPLHPVTGTTEPVAINIDKDAIIREIISKIPDRGVVYEIAPLEKLKKDFLQEAKNRIYSDISGLSDEIKKSIKFIEVLGRRTSKMEIYKNGLGYKGGYAGGGTFDKGINECVSLQLIKKDDKGFYPGIENRIIAECSNFGITDDEVQQVYDHIIAEMLGDK